MEKTDLKMEPKRLYESSFGKRSVADMPLGIMHNEPSSEEGPTIAKRLPFIGNNGYSPAGRHHEIYLSDIGNVAPEKRKTVIRQSISKGRYYAV